MANGYCTGILRHINDIAEGNAASKKMHVAGFMAMLFCCANSSVSPVNDGNQANGQRRGVTVKYRRRPTASDVQSVDNCDINRIPGYQEFTIPNLGFKSTSWFLSDDEIRKFCDDAIAARNIGGGTPTIVNEHYELFLEHSNILMSEINRSLVTAAGSQFGDNVTTGSSTGKVINIARNGDQYILDNGIVDMMRDIQENEICGEPCIVGGGLLAAWNIANTASCCNQAGMNLGQLGVPRFFFDKHTQSIWGQNTAGLFAPGSVKFLGFNKYVGAAYSGARGTSYFTTVPMPVADFGCNSDDCLNQLVFDLQMRYIDCPTTIDVTVDGVSTPTEVNRGWQFILSKEYALWVQPDNMYPSGDELEGTNGTLKYFFSNTTGTAASYAYP
jgi:hypothetical protein